MQRSQLKKLKSTATKPQSPLTKSKKSRALSTTTKSKRTPKQASSPQFHPQITPSFQTQTTALNTLPHPLLSTTSRSFSSQNADRSKLKRLDVGISTVEQLDALHSSGKLGSAKDLQLKAKAAELEHQKKKEIQAKASKDGKLKAGQEVSNEQIEAQLHEINQAAHITPPPQNISHPAHSTHFLPMWDHNFTANKQLVETFERTTSLKVSDMDLVGTSVDAVVNGDSVTDAQLPIRQRLQGTNRVSLVMIASTDATFQYGSVCAQLWAREFEKHGMSNQDGALIVQPTLVTITEGFLAKLFSKSIIRKVGAGLDPHLTRPHAFSFHINQVDGPIARARRFLNCRNRYAANLFLVDERGLIRWQSQIATMPTKDFMQVLFNVTNDLLLETQYNEAD